MPIQDGVGVRGSQLVIVRNGVIVVAITENGLQTLPNKTINGAAITKQSSIADPSGGATVDSQARTAIVAILDALENFGVIEGPGAA